MNEVPFHSQKWDLSQWKQLGYTSKEDAEYWEKSSCAILCLQMAAEFFLKKSYTTSDLIKEGVALDAYTDALGWSHKGVCKLAEKMGLKASSSHYTPAMIHKAVEEGSLFLVSIKWGFHPTKSSRERILFWKKYGGHIALVIGARVANGKLEGFYVHHTSIRDGYNWPSRFIPLKEFRRGYTGRAIAVSRP